MTQKETVDEILEEVLYDKKDLIANRNFLLRNPKLVKDVDESVAGIDENIRLCDEIAQKAQTMVWRDKK